MRNDAPHQHALRRVGALIEVVERQVHDAPYIMRAFELGEGVELVAERDQGTVGIERALRVCAGAGGVDDGRWIVRPHRFAAAGEVVRADGFAKLDQFPKRQQRRVLGVEHVAVVDDDKLPQGRKPVEHRQHLVDVLLILGDQHRSAGMAQHVLRLVTRTGRIEAVADRADALRGEVGEQPFRRRIADDGNAVAGLHAQRDQATADALDLLGQFLPRGFAVEAAAFHAQRNLARRARAPHGPAATEWSAALHPAQAPGRRDGQTAPHGYRAASYSQHPHPRRGPPLHRAAGRTRTDVSWESALGRASGDCFLSIIR